MKFIQFVSAAALVVAPATGFGAIVSVINGDTADAVVQGPSTSGPQDGNGTSVGTLGGFTLKVGSNNAPGSTNADRGRAAVYVFQLPNLGALANPFTAASLSFGLGTIDGSTAVDADLYGLSRRDAAPAVVTSDYYFGNLPDTTDATRLQVTILSPTSTPISIISTDATGSENLLAFLNSQYAVGRAGEYVYLRLNVDGGLSNIARGYNVHTADDPDAAKRPTISYTAIPEPASLALLALGGLSLVRRRRSR